MSEDMWEQGAAAAQRQDWEVEQVAVERLDRYRLQVGSINVVATPDQESRIRELSAEQRARFERVMGGKQ